MVHVLVGKGNLFGGHLSIVELLQLEIIQAKQSVVRPYGDHEYRIILFVYRQRVKLLPVTNIIDLIQRFYITTCEY